MTVRTYRLPAADRTGWLLGLSGAQVIPLAIGLAGAVTIIARGGPASIGLLPFMLGVAVAFTRLAEVPLLEAAPILVKFVLRRDRRFDAPFPLPARELVLPPAFGQVEFLEVRFDGSTRVVAVDRSAGLAAATLRVTAPAAFLLCDEAEQVRFLDNFGAALAPLCRDRGPVTSLRWVSFATPAGRGPGGAIDGPAAPAYREVLDLLAGEAHHEVFLTVTVRGTGRDSSGERLAETLLSEAALLSDRLAGAGLQATIIDAAQLSVALRQRLDPVGRGSPAHLVTLAGASGRASVAAAGPLCVEEGWKQVRIDATTHRCYHVVEWPRSDVPPAWTADLLLALPVTRTVCVVLEPVAPRASRRSVQRQAAKLDSDEEQRRRVGFRIGAEQEATRDALAVRERELVAGHPEFDCSGFVVLSADEPADLDEFEAQVRSVAAAAGVELAACHGRHAEGLAIVLPTPLAPSRKIR